MACYQSSWDNRVYVGLESDFGVVSAEPRLVPAVRLQVRHERERLRRQDKSGTRTYHSISRGVRTTTAWALRTYLAGWNESAESPVYDPLFRGLTGGPARSTHAQAAQIQGNSVTFPAGHSLRVGQAVAVGTDIRFVTHIADGSQVQVNAPFAGGSGTSMRTITYELGGDLPSNSIFDHWGPETAVQRILRGAAVDRLEVRLNGDFHIFDFAGPAADVIDSQSLSDGDGGLDVFPSEPTVLDAPASVVPGSLGQIWIGYNSERLYSVLEATLRIRNGVEMRAHEFGSVLPRCMNPGPREVDLSFKIFSEDKAQIKDLYEAARSQSPIPVMLQLGDTPGEMFGVYIKSVLLQVPEFDDSEKRLIWAFRASPAEGWVDDEAYMAFA